ncbi:hypothetical protein [Geminocystis sp. NIES-3709]|uniref:hypothetical protein n=1 Tax=Geminocystis sp. NIES-3709 TaxID=1617448 RepID=UPI0005FCB4CF|nr:hypothetical protein [Geminocystis sp. NIES-3709]BAQ65545.1 hypothetical protein GM3709_2310 [Geminocystis sp. NIES-3709]
MSNLQSRNNLTLDTLASIQGSIKDLQAQLELLNNKFTDATKVANAQANLTKRWKEAIAPLKDLLKYSCGVYGDPEVLNEMVADIQEMADAVANNFDKHKGEENPYLDGVKEKQPEPEVVITLLPDLDESMPDVDDNETFLNERQALKLIEHLDKTILKKLAVLNDFGNLSTPKAIAKKISESAITRYQLEQDLQRINPTQSLPMAS